MVRRKIPLEDLSFRQLLNLDACTRCGECLKWCPVYAQDPREEVTPRGKIASLKNILRRQRWRFLVVQEEEVERLAHALFECTACGQCRFVCPSHMDTATLWESVRECLVKGGYGPEPGHHELLSAIKSSDNPWRYPRERRAGWLEEGIAANIIRYRPPNPVREKVEVLYFVGCTAAYDPKVKRIAQYTTAILQEANIDFGLLGDKENCCRGKLRRVGDPEFKYYGSQNVNLLNDLGVKTVVTACPGCYKTLKQDYPRLGRQSYQVLHVVELFDQLIAEGRLAPQALPPMTVTYHDPCHLGRHNGVYEPPRRVLTSIQGISLKEMSRHRQNARCCGVGGGLKNADHELQVKMSAARIYDAEETGADALVTPCPSCFGGLQTGIEAAGSTIKLYHLVELLAASLRIEPALMAIAGNAGLCVGAGDESLPNYKSEAVS